MPAQPSLVRVTGSDVEARGFFCYMSKKKSPGHQRKLAWVRARLGEGMRLTLLPSPERGFIEYLPGEHAWRAVRADGYLFIHCLWVVGKSKGRGLGARLLDACIADAKESGARGVAMLTSDRVWLAGRGLLEREGFECVDRAEPFALMVKSFRKGPAPKLAGGWDEKADAFGKGLTVLRSDQCPYVEDATAAALSAAQKAGVSCRVVELESRDEVLRRSPTPYGVFALVLDGAPLSYHYLLEKDLLPLLRGEREAGR